VIEPLFADDAFLENLSKMEASSGDRVVIAWLGQSGYLVCHKGFRFLIDPYLSDSLTRKYAETTKPHERVSRMVITPERLTGISFVTSSHNHTDHLDGETLAKLIGANPGVKVIVPRANYTFALDRLVSAGVANTATYLVAIPVDETLTMSDLKPASHRAQASASSSSSSILVVSRLPISGTR
jgi:L-ascorbate metabolism protein UlaG (beta-lactamase superfamily)